MEFRSKLIELVKKQHLEFLKGRSEQEQQVDYDKLKCWHSEFDVNSLPPIPQQEFPGKPFRKKVGRVQDFLAQSTAQNMLIKRAMEEVVKDYDQKVQATNAAKEPQKAEEQHGISGRLLRMIQEKERILAESKKKNEFVDKQKAENSAKKDEVLKVVQMILDYYNHRKVSNMFYVNVLDHLATKTSLLISKDEIEKIMAYLCKGCPNWLKIVENESGRLLRVDRKLTFPEIAATIEKDLGLDLSLIHI
eukprot:TRINITY_DN12400_c0_g1_i3.p1 TRINITY_DN12400_c0_g1~~TRINITY_DN12400_c0_g1_i3.p1  ORF type:complete len:248 (-),score=58.02 TRINITY_DN12400_c0_g1_i3:61-804(-)